MVCITKCAVRLWFMWKNMFWSLPPTSVITCNKCVIGESQTLSLGGRLVLGFPMARYFLLTRSDEIWKSMHVMMSVLKLYFFIIKLCNCKLYMTMHLVCLFITRVLEQCFSHWHAISMFVITGQLVQQVIVYLLVSTGKHATVYLFIGQLVWEDSTFSLGVSLQYHLLLLIKRGWLMNSHCLCEWYVCEGERERASVCVCERER